jgi:hypothetical protein
MLGKQKNVYMKLMRLLRTPAESSWVDRGKQKYGPTNLK